jgi:hypothetical protein
VLFTSAVPVNVGRVLAVMSSVLDEPVSLAATRSGVPGLAGGVLSAGRVVDVVLEDVLDDVLEEVLDDVLEVVGALPVDTAHWVA